MANQHVVLSKNEKEVLKEAWTQIENGADNELDFWSYAAGYLRGCHPSWEDSALQEITSELKSYVELWANEYYGNLDETLMPEII